MNVPNWAWVAVLVAGLGFLHSRTGPGWHHTAGPGARVYLFGDSLAQGLTGPMKALAEASGLPFAADSQVGSTFPQWLTRGPQGVKDFGATHVFVSLGTNDAAANPEHQAKVAGWARDLTEAMPPGVVVYFVAPPDPMPFSLDTVMAGLRRSGGILLVENTPLPRYDRIHPTPEAFKQWAADLWATGIKGT